LKKLFREHHFGRRNKKDYLKKTKEKLKKPRSREQSKKNN